VAVKFTVVNRRIYSSYYTTYLQLARKLEKETAFVLPETYDLAKVETKLIIILFHLQFFSLANFLFGFKNSVVISRLQLWMLCLITTWYLLIWSPLISMTFLRMSGIMPCCLFGKFVVGSLTCLLCKRAVYLYTFALNKTVVVMQWTSFIIESKQPNQKLLT